MAILSEKTRQFIRGRKGQFKRIEAACRGVENIVWVHASSYGEFEEARPVITEIRSAHPECRILVTFFSPTGYEHLKDDPIADFVFYLPLDTRRNARRFLDLVRPVKVIVSVSDYWLNFLHELRRRGTDTYLISANFHPSMGYFKPYGFPYRKAFRSCFKKIIVRDEDSLGYIRGIGATNTILAGDPRMDRVMAIAALEWSNPIVDEWTAGRKVFVCGSDLPDMDDEVMIELCNAHPSDKFLIIPHEQGQKQIEHLREGIRGSVVLYTEAEAGAPFKDAQVLLVNTVGMLSRLYRYGFAAYVGSGFADSPHSVIEPASYGIPVAYGPNFGSHYHCRYLIECGAGAAIHNGAELCAWYDALVRDPASAEKAGKAAREYCVKGSGVARKIMEEIMR